MLTGIDSSAKTPSRMGFRRGLVQVRRGERDEPYYESPRLRMVVRLRLGSRGWSKAARQTAR